MSARADAPLREPDIERGLRLVGQLLELMRELDERVAELASQVAALQTAVDGLRRRAA